MASSQARIDANRRNALKSTGPKTAEGKEKSRANALKHGLSGAGVVLPPDDLAKVADLEAKVAADIPPRDEVTAAMIHRFAVASIRLDRCAAHDAAMTAQRVRHAAVDRDNRRYDEVAALGQRLAEEPSDAVRRLKQTPEGLDWLLEQWLEVRAEVAGPVADPAGVANRAGALLGLSPARTRVTEWGSWARAVAGGPSDLAEDPARWAVERVDREIVTVRNLLALVDWDAEAADRAGAAARALLDFSPEGERARRYEAAAERQFFRTLRELRRAQAASENEPTPAPSPAPLPPPPPRVPAPLPMPPAPVRSILDDLPAPARGAASGFGDFLDIAASRPGAGRVETNPRAARPKLR